MTAVVGILNKRAVSLAADSAVTIQNGKIFNKANKLFTLSKYHPVGVMIHNDATFMDTPWETIIKVYRNQLKTKSFPTLAEYKADFIDFIKKEDFFCDSEHQLKALHDFCRGITAHLFKVANEEISSNPGLEFLPTFKKKSIEWANKFSASTEKNPDFDSYSYDDFEKLIKPTIDGPIEKSLDDNGHQIDQEAKDLLAKAYYHELIVKEFSTTHFTGIVFAGFGDKEIFPSLIPIRVFFGFEKKLRFFVDDDSGWSITHDTPSGICTFAQSDVIHTILTGIAPDLRETYNLHFENFLGTYEEFLISNYPHPDKGDLLHLLGSIDKNKIMQRYIETTSEIIRDKFVSRLFNAVASLAKEDLAEMAESLIYLTYLQRRITNAEESVGGPVDVAVISKGDGFIWIKRKHYFTPELNPNFFKKYFN